MTHGFKSKKFTFLLAGLTLFFIVFFTLFFPKFDTNDDFAMMSIANGFYYGKPSQHLIYTNVIIGFILKLLYTVSSNVSWYALYLYFFHFIACLVIVYTFLLSKKSNIQFLLFISSLSLFEIQILMNLQFTSTSLLLGFSGIFYYIGLLQQKKESYWVAIISGVILGSVGFIRASSFTGILAFSFPILLYALKYLPLRKNIVFALCALSIFFLSNLTNNLYYSFDPGWNSYFQFNKVRGSLHGTPKLDWHKNVRDVLHKINWSENDFAMFGSWFYTDRKVFSVNAIQTITKEINLESTRSLNLKPTFVGLSHYFLKEIVYVLILFTFLLILASKKRKLFLIMLIVWHFLVSIYLIDFVRFPARIAIPFFLFTSLDLLLFSEIKHLFWSQKRWFMKMIYNFTIISFLLLLLASPLRHNLFSESRNNRSNHQQFITILKSLKELNPEGIFVTWGASLNYDWCSPFVTKKHLPDLKLIGLGWRINSPPYLDLLRQLKIDDLYEAIATRNELYLIAKADLVPLYEKYMLEHYGKKVKLRSLLTFDESDESLDESEKIKVFHNLS